MNQYEYIPWSPVSTAGLPEEVQFVGKSNVKYIRSDNVYKRKGGYHADTMSIAAVRHLWNNKILEHSKMTESDIHNAIIKMGSSFSTYSSLPNRVRFVSNRQEVYIKHPHLGYETSQREGYISASLATDLLDMKVLEPASPTEDEVYYALYKIGTARTCAECHPEFASKLVDLVKEEYGE